MDERDQIFLERLAEATESAPIAADASLAAAEWDSIVVLSVIALIDEVYGVTVPAKELTSVDSVPKLLELVRAAQ
ncbi:MAG TPA: phosphopantetheine-binding protein [Thermoanaerobaculia bacterium]|nr:phosphopantetheine-binding protein [Thermoanaerobaculia bacterium]